MTLLAVLLVALAAMDLSGTSAADRDRDGECLCYFPDKSEGDGSIYMFTPEYGTLSKYFQYIMNGRQGRVALWVKEGNSLILENPDYIMDLKMDVLYKLDRDPMGPCRKAKLPDEWRLSNCLPFGLSFEGRTVHGKYLYKTKDRKKHYSMIQNSSIEGEPCPFYSIYDFKTVSGVYGRINLLSLYLGKNPEKLALDLSNCTQVETLNFPFQYFYPDSETTTTSPTTSNTTTTSSTTTNKE